MLKKLNYIKFNIADKLIQAVTIVLLLVTVLAYSKFDIIGASVKPEISGDSGVIMSNSTMEEIYDFHGDRKLNPGISTKLMVAMNVIDKMHNKNEFKNVIEVDSKIASYGNKFHLSEEISVEDLLKTMLIENSDQAAVALAIYSSGSEEEFIKEMNSKATQLGLTYTKYDNLIGKAGKNQFTTAGEVAIITTEALRYDKIREIAYKKSCNIEIKGNRREKIQNGDLLIKKNKSGYKGMMCSFWDEKSDYPIYIGEARKDGLHIIVVLMGEPAGLKNREASEMLDFGFKNSSHITVDKKNKKCGHIKIKNGEKTIVPVYTLEKAYAHIPKEGSKSLVRTEKKIKRNFNAPIKKGTKVGDYEIYVADELKGVIPIIVTENVNRGWPLSRFYISNLATATIIIIFISLLLILFRIRMMNIKRKKILNKKRKDKIRKEALKRKALEESEKREWHF